MPTNANRIHILTFNLPDDGALLSTNSVPQMVSTPTTIVAAPGSITLQDVTNAVVQHNSGNVNIMTYTDVMINTAQNLTSAPGHEPGYLVDVQGTTSTKQIMLKNSLGNTGDMIVKSATGPEWAPDYYSTIYDLLEAPAVAGTSDEGGNYAVVLDPRNGYTQYLDIRNNATNIPTSLVLPVGLPTGRRWAVRLELRDPNENFRYDMFHPVSTPTVDWASDLSGVNKSLAQVNLYEFYTRDGGNTWVGCEYHGGNILN